MSKNKYLVIILFLLTYSARAQYSRLSVEVYAGFPTSLTFFTPGLSTYGGFGVKYAILKEISVAGHLSFGALVGNNTSAYKTNTLDYTDHNNFKSFTNNFVQYTLEGQLNLERVLGLRRHMHKLNPFLVVGGGIESSSTTRISVGGLNDKNYVYPFQTIYIGLNFKYYLNPTLDLSFGSNYNTAQTYYNDAVPSDKTLDSYLLNYIGVSYKIGARKDRQHIEWNNVILKDRIYIPNLEEHLGQPVDLAGNYFIFHKDSIAKLQSQNIELQNKTAQLETKSTELVAKNTSQQNQIDSMQAQVNAIKVALDTLKTQKNTEAPIIIDTTKIVSSDEKKIISKLLSENKDLRIKDKKLELNAAEQQKQIDNMQNQLNQVKKQLDAKPEIKLVTPPVETPANKNLEPVPVIKETPKKAKVETPKTEAPSIPKNDGLNKIDNVTAPIATYNVIAGAYAGDKYANIYRDKLRAKGYEAAVFKSDINSRIYRVSVFSTDDKQAALKMMRKVRAEVEPQSWIHVYHQK